jgi:hypothetical protein
MLSVWAAGICSAVLVVVWLTMPTYAEDEPAPIPYRIPILGNAIEFAADRRSFFAKFE